MKLVSNWRASWKWASMHAMAAALAIQAAWVAIPSELQALVHPLIAHVMTAFLLVAGIVGRLVDQAPKSAPADKTDA